MYLGIQEVRTNVRGAFEKFYFRMTLKRTRKTEHFKCFKDNNKKEHSEIDFLYARNSKDADEMFQHWSNFYNDDSWKYEPIRASFLKKEIMSVDSVVDDFHTSKPDKLIHYENNIREIIH